MHSHSVRWSRYVCTAVLAGVLAVVQGSPSSVVVAQSNPLPLIPFRGLIDHVSANSTPWGIPSSGAQSWPHSISGDGRYVVMESSASDLVQNDFNSLPDIFLRDRQTGSTTRVSVAVDGTDPDGMNQYATISSNGRHVAFASGASNLVAGDTNGHWDVFVRDLDRSRTVRISVATDGTQSDADSGFPVISPDGRFVVFQSGASTLVPGAMPYQPMQAYIHDRDSDGNGVFDEPGRTTTTLVSVSMWGTAADSRVDNLRVTADGRFVLFETDATNIVPVPTPNYFSHLYVRDLQTNHTTLIDAAATGGPSASGVSWRSSDMSDDGRYITYASASSDIVPAAANGRAQVFRYDANADATPRTTIVSILPGGTLADDSSDATSVTADGRYIAFTTAATNLATPAPVSGTRGLVVRDMIEGTFTRLDVIETGAPFDHAYPFSPAVSADGTAVAFQSNAQNALNGAFTWGADHVFVATAFTPSTVSVSMPMAGGTGAIDVNTTPVSGWKAVSFDDWIVVTDGGEYAAGPRTVLFLVSANDSGIARDGHVRVGSTMVSIHQDGDGDTTPPVITPTITGTLGGDGWYVGTVTVQWTVSDPDSPIVSQSWNCGTIVTIASDAIYAPVTCEAASHGGSASNTVVIRRDGTPPVISIARPAATIYSAGASVLPSFTCTDANGYSGVATCAISEGSTPLDTTPGRHVFAVTATDRAGNSTTKSVDYFVGTGACVSPNDSLKAWWRFEGNTFDALANLHAMEMPSATSQYAPAVVGQSWEAQGTHLLTTDESGRLEGLHASTIAAWIRPAGQIGESGTIVSNPVFRIARYPDGTLRWAFYQPAGFDWVNTGVVIPIGVWTHVAVSQDGGLVKTYVNGRLAHAQQLAGSPYAATSLFIGGRPDVDAYYVGGLDELQVFGSALAAEEIEAIAMAGNGGLCLPKVTTLTVSVPPAVAYAATFPVTATLRDEAGNAIAGKLVNLYSYVSPAGYYAGGTSGTTDSAGQILAQLPMSMNVTVGSYAPGVRAIYAGDAHDTPSRVDVTVTVVKGTPTITWPSPSAIVYGAALGASQLNAAADTTGTFTYSPAPGTFLGAGAHELSVTFTPADTDRWNEATATTMLIVDKAVPTVTIDGGPFTYDGLAHQATVVVHGVGGDMISPTNVVYDEGPAALVQAGTHTLRVSYDGNSNYEAVTAEGALVIGKATPTVSLTGLTVTFDGQAHSVPVDAIGVNNESLAPIVVTYNGSATVPSNVGTYEITARYDGSTNYHAVSKRATLQILKAPSHVTWPTPADMVYGAALTAAQLNATANVPGTFNYSPALGTVLNAGSHQLSVTFTPDDAANYLGSGATVSLTVAKAATSITWPVPSDIRYGTALNVAQLNATANVPGTFSYSPAAGTVPAAGSHTLSATFTPSDAANYNGSSAARTLTVKQAPLTIVTNAAAKPYGAPLPLFSVSTSDFVNGDSLASLSGTLSFSTPATSASPVGTYPVTPQGLSSANYAITFAPGTLTVVPASSATAVVVTPNPAGSNQPITMTASVSVITPGAGSPGGVVQFYDGGTLLGSASLVTGTATLTTNGLAVGSHTVTATYSGDASFAGSTATCALTVNPASSSSTTAVTSSANPATVGQNVTLTATVTASGTLSGSVEFYDGSVLLGSATLSGTTARFTMSGLATGGHAITARYLGNASIPPSTSPAFAQYVQVSGAKTRASTAAIAASPSPATLGSMVTMTATVTGTNRQAPTGTIVFMVNGTVLGQGTLSATGSATAAASVDTSTLPHGSHRVEAVYLGDAMYRANTASMTLVVN